jgi:hypothetical protein
VPELVIEMPDDNVSASLSDERPKFRPLFARDPIFASVPPLLLEVEHQGWWKTTVSHETVEDLQRRLREQAAREAQPKTGIIRWLARLLHTAGS